MSRLLVVIAVVLVSLIAINGVMTKEEEMPISGAPPYGEDESEVPELDPYAWIREWTRPEGPARVGLQVGHWKNDELPEELGRLIGNTGSSGGGKSESEVNYAIAEETKKILEAEGVVVDLLPATVPPRYWADVFVALHADGSTDRSISGYKFAGPWRDFTGKQRTLLQILEPKYEQATGLARDPNISRNMRGYYAFSWWRYQHAIHPMTVGIIAETGFLTNRSDQNLLINTPEIPARAIADGLLEYLRNEGLVL